VTEAEWLACEEPFTLLGFLGDQACGRRLRLLAAGCCRKLWHRLTDERCRTAIEICEQYADGAASKTELLDAEFAETAAAFALNEHPWSPQLAGSIAKACATENLWRAVYEVAGNMRLFVPEAEHAQKYLWQAAALRDIFGNPFRPVCFDVAWRTSTAVALACGMYEAREFSAMPILADALQDAGCARAEILDHCRGHGPHVRGCWVVDLVLGKE
jgi:hypothetical protein